MNDLAAVVELYRLMKLVSHKKKSDVEKNRVDFFPVVCLALTERKKSNEQKKFES